MVPDSGLSADCSRKSSENRGDNKPSWRPNPGVGQVRASGQGSGLAQSFSFRTPSSAEKEGGQAGEMDGPADTGRNNPPVGTR